MANVSNAKTSSDLERASGYFAAILDAVAKPAFQFKLLFTAQSASSELPALEAVSTSIVEGAECYEALTTSTNTGKAHHLESEEGAHWESNGPSGTHWIQLNFVPDFYISNLSIKCKTRDSYRVSKVTLKVGTDDADLTEIETIACDSVREGDMLPLLSDCDECHSVLRMCISADGINCRIDQIVV